MNRLTGQRVNNAWRRMLGMLLALLLPMPLIAANAPLGAGWRDVRPGDSPDRVLEAYRRNELNSFDPNLLHQVPRAGLGTWVVIQPQAPLLREERVLSITPPPLSSVSLYRADGSVETLALDDFSAPAHGHGRLSFRLTDDQPANAAVLLKFEPALSAAPVRFELQSWSDYLHSDARWLVFSSACFAIMAAMALMALCLALMLRDATFGWYAGYILCYSLIQGMRSGFLFHPLEIEWLAGTAGLIAPTAAALSVAFAAVFVTRFCELPRFAPLLHAPTLALAVGMPLVVLLRSSHIDVLEQAGQALLNPLMILGAALLLLAGGLSGARGSRRAWYFLVGWTPLLGLTAMTSAQNSGAMPDVEWLGDACLAAGAFQAIVLSLGLADRALAMRHDSNVVRELADVDALTQVLNRRAWSERLEHLLGQHDGQPMALLFLDLDYFKTLNDRQGHAAGDRALVAVADSLRHELRPQDALGRWGGEEFVAMLRGVDQQQAMQIAIRLCRRVHRLEIPVNEEQLLLSISIGVAMRQADDTVESLVERADHAMYRAKLQGRNRVRLDEKLEDRMVREWPRAVERGHE
ncbi:MULTISPECIES: GGDEF domain-containing protein [Dyella]|uniref:diguanylate cyclase n=2 Tax=Dyella TaxID=231454 RepID=A0A4R0YTJ9_9GAMM|nr:MULTISPECIES: diguanylate cyclase [Dyella]TBR39713.1 diguanylate cyclase [Dyella terrae]TCI12705.1 diguanylate cyclase [Dyella soli]